MADRRTLIDALKTDPVREKEQEFVYADKPKPTPAQEPPVQMSQSVRNLASAMNFYNGVRVPLTSRVRPEVAAMLKRISLERQLAGIRPCALQDIVEEALDAWLAVNGPSHV